MAPEKKYVNVDEIMPTLSVEDVARYYGVQLPALHRVGNEIRTRCFLNCGKPQETGDRAIAIQADSATKNWYCHQYGCGKSGNLVSLCDLLKPGESTGGRPRGERFKGIAADLKAMSEGQPGPAPSAVAPTASSAPVIPKANLPLKDSENERARSLVDLDAKFLTDVADMTPKASAYFRCRPYLTPEICNRWRMGYLPRGTAGEDKSGGTMRGKVVYGYCNDAAEVLTWFGRDPEFEDKHKSWSASGRTEKEPEKFHFVKGFHRGGELFGVDHLAEAGRGDKIRELGLLLVEGPNDVIRLDTLGIPAVALCSNTITREQAEKVVKISREQGSGIVTIFLDCDPEGLSGMKQCLGYIAQLAPVRLAWTDRMHGGKFGGRQPESLSLQEWQGIEAFLLACQ